MSQSTSQKGEDSQALYETRQLQAIAARWDAKAASWDKELAGTGYWARNQHELLLIATRGAPALPEPADVPASMYRERKAEHSAKPEHYRELIERMTPGMPRIELFARSVRPGWAAWGNQAQPAPTREADE